MVLLLLTSFAFVDGDFVAAVPVFVPFAAEAVPVVFFSPTLFFEAGAPVEPVGVLVAAAVGVLFLTAAAGVFLDTPLVGGLDVPFDRRLWTVLGRGAEVVFPAVEVVLPAVVVLGLDLSKALLDELAL